MGAATSLAQQKDCAPSHRAPGTRAGDLSVCTECQIPHVQAKEGLYPDPATGLW